MSFCQVSCTAFVLLMSASVVAQTGQVRQASAELPVSRAAYRFTFEQPQVGRQIWQHVTTFADLTTRYAQDGQSISQVSRRLTREQIRRLTVLELDRQQGKIKVRLNYEKASRSLMERGHDPEVTDQPVKGNSYHVSRPKKDLVVTYVDGSQPPPEETEIVKKNMQAIGRINPLAQFLNVKSVYVGEVLTLPPELAAQLGWDGEYGKTSQVSLELVEVRQINGSNCGVFSSQIVGAAKQGSRPTSMKGKVTIEMKTCRTMVADMKVELNTNQQRGPVGHTFTVSHRGQANLHTQVRYLR